MGTFGSIQGMIISYRENMKLLRKSRLSGRNKDHSEAIYTNFDKEAGHIDIEKVSDEKIAEIGRRTREANRNIRRRIILAFIPTLAVFLLFAWLIASNFASTTSEKNKLIQLLLDDIDPDSYDKYVNVGDKYFNAQLWDRAIEEYVKALRITPDNFAVRYNLALSYLQNCKSKNSNCTEAETELNRLIKIRPDRAELYVLRANYYLKSGETDKADKDLERADELSGSKNQQISD